MTEELKPCPFCGGEAETFNPFDNIAGTWCVICCECACASGFEQTETEATEAWNTRAERTCEVDNVISWGLTTTEPYYEFELSCGHTATGYDEQPPNFCPNCGSQLIRKDVKR